MKKLMNSNDFLKVKESKEFYYNNINYYNFIYKPFNDLCSLFFKNKINHFFQKSEPFLIYSKIESTALKNKLINAIATDNYTVNTLSHYIFNISGKVYTYGVIEIESIIDEGLKIKRAEKLKEVKKDNVFQFKKLTTIKK